jgi:PAS domain S-box-containing protein
MTPGETFPCRQTGNATPGKEEDERELRIAELSGQLAQMARQLEQESELRRQSEEALAESEERFRVVADFSGNWEYWIDTAGRCRHISPACLRITGYSAEDFYENPDLLPAIIHPEDRPRFIAHLEEEIRLTTDFYFEFRILTRSGEQLWLAHNCRPILKKDGTHLGRWASNRNITSLKKAEDALKEREKFFRMVLDATSNGVWDRNLRSGEVFYGENWARMLGYTAEEVRAKKITWEHLLHPEDRHGALAAVLDHIQGLTSRYVAEFRMRNKAGGWQWVLARGKVVEWDENGRPLRFVGTHCDISDRKKAEDDLRESSRKIKEFAYSVVHDLKNPVIAIHGLTKLLHNRYRGVLDEKGRKFCAQILRSSEQIAALVEKINMFIAAQEAPLFFQEVSLQECIEAIREEFSVQLEQRSIAWIEPLQPPVVTADRIALLRVLRNLVDNALKYGGENLSEIEIGYHDAGDFHVLSVRDNGIGMAKEESNGIFGMFARQKTALGIAGTGLGLAIVKEIAAHHGGQVWIEHEQQQGITFYVSFAKALD